MIDEKYIFTGATKVKLFALMAVGAVLLLLGIWVTSSGSGNGHDGHGEKKEVASKEVKPEGGKEVKAEVKGAAEETHKPVWMLRLLKNLWHNNVFFTGISIIGVFFVAFNYVAWAGWSAALKRVPEAFGYFLPIAAILMIVVFAIAGHDLFHWTHETLYQKYLPDGKTPNPEYDEIIAGKAGFLNPTFFWIRLVGYFFLWILIWFMIRTFSLKEDIEGGVKWHDKSVIWSAGFLFVFAVTSSTSAWDWVMSVDTHFFSTMFGWYVFASWFVTGLSVVTLFVVYLKDAGYLKVINENHVHDLGKFVFAFSIFWTYIWFAQFLLIYYANIPEESIYWVERLQNPIYTPIFFMNLILNFLFPFLILMTRDAKRQTMILKVVCFVVIFGHWSDFYIMLTPGTLKGEGGFGFTTLLVELGMTMIYAGIFIFTVLWGLTRANLVPKNHPMLQESLHHHVY
ncbi:MAG: quinol:cytochrome C oxidoreductase [Cytophagaceae bacterium]|nr:quinol:cytochrome C oxidoreductase [Cytophagaceae bacterium]